MPLALPALSAVVFNKGGRYTGQQLDDDTGLYFYNSRYYDPELARFVQADTIVPSANTSQALNRYAYVKNNPLKFTDPSGHGFRDFLQKTLGKHFGDVLNIIGAITMNPWLILAGTAYNVFVIQRGNFGDFATQLGINIAAAGIADAVGGLATGSDGWATAVKNGWSHFAGPADVAIYGALVGAASGAISSAIYGGNVWKNMGEGAAAGAATSLATSWAQGKADARQSAEAAKGEDPRAFEDKVIQACALRADAPWRYSVGFG